MMQRDELAGKSLVAITAVTPKILGGITGLWDCEAIMEAGLISAGTALISSIGVALIVAGILSIGIPLLAHWVSRWR